MKHFSICTKRWSNFRQALLELGKGRMDHQLKIGTKNDAFEAMEALFNMVLEELRSRLLHLSFVKPAAFQRYTNQYLLITNKNFRIQNACDTFLTHYQLELQQLKERSFLEMIDEDSATTIKDNYCKTTDTKTNTPLHIELFEDRFLCIIIKLANNKWAIKLYQFHLQKEHFKATYEMADSEKARVFENKRYYEIIEKIKDDIDQFPLKVRVNMEKIVKDHGINSNLVKKLFKEQYGSGIYEYQIILRMNEAYQLVSCTEKSFKEIATETGYMENLVKLIT